MTHKAKPKTTPEHEKKAVVAEAMFNAAKFLHISDKKLASIIGVSESSISRIRQGSYTPLASKKTFELSVLFIRMYRSLDSITGGDDEVSRRWLNNNNLFLNHKPIELISTITGIVNVITYLDARRAII